MKRRYVASLIGLPILVVLLPIVIIYGCPIWTARRHLSIAQAICNYRARNGVLPDSLEELVPEHLAVLPPHWPGLYQIGKLYIPGNLPHTWIFYSFREGEAGWISTGDFGVGRLPVPIVAPTVQSVSGDDMVRARLATYDRRIESQPHEFRHRVAKIAYLLSLQRSQDAYLECRAAAEALPHYWRVHMGQATLAPANEASAAEIRFCSWVKEHPAFIHYWYLARYYRDSGRSRDALEALRQAVKHPLQDVDEDEPLVPTAIAFDAARYACQQKEPTLVLDIVKRWSWPQGAYSNPGNDLPAFRAAAELALGQFDEAKKDVAKVNPMRMAIWAQNLDKLESAIDRKDTSFVYDPGGLMKRELILFPAEE
jgi:tetratricopeptide (TPR) repeat protein